MRLIWLLYDGTGSRGGVVDRALEAPEARKSDFGCLSLSPTPRRQPVPRSGRAEELSRCQQRLRDMDVLRAQRREYNDLYRAHQATTTQDALKMDMMLSLLAAQNAGGPNTSYNPASRRENYYTRTQTTPHHQLVRIFLPVASTNAEHAARWTLDLPGV